jgi:hypothetical protein
VKRQAATVYSRSAAHQFGQKPLTAESNPVARDQPAFLNPIFARRKGGAARNTRLTGLTYCAAARIGTCAFKKLRTRLMVRCFSSSGSFHGNTVISAFGASEATSIEVCSGCPGTSSGSTSIGVRQFLMKSRDTLYRKSGCTA